MTWTVDGTPFIVGPGQALCIPRGAVHMFMNTGTTASRALCVHQSGGAGAGILPRDGGGDHRGSRWTSGSGEGDGGDGAPPASA